MPDRPRSVVLGGGFGGVGAIKKLADADAPLLLRPEDLDGHSVPTLWLSLTHEHASDRADAFVYRAITRATSGVVVSRADIHAAAPTSSANTAP